MFGRRYAVLALCINGLLFVGMPATADAQPLGSDGPPAFRLHLTLPTSNDALFRNDGEAFYQYTDRYYKGKRTRPWQGGQYGFVRNTRETAYGTIYTRFHEGVDIKPLYRDGAGEPQDTVQAIDIGEVVYVNPVEKNSNYGKYVVVEHWWDGSPFYSLYAHLDAVYVQAGEYVAHGDRLGRMGYTGVGINRRRAHVHFEINMLLNRVFQPWYNDYFEPSDPNHHGIYSGLNLAGLDVPALYLGLRTDSTLSIQKFITTQPAFFQVVVPNTGMLDILWRYPWLSPSLDILMGFYEEVEPAASWTLTFTQSGLPIRIDPTPDEVTEPTVIMLEPSPIDYRYLTNGLLTGTGHAAALSKTGLRYIDLLTRRPAPDYLEADY